MGKIITTTNKNSLPEYRGANETTPENIAKMVNVLQADKTLYQSLKHNCQQAKTTLCWSKEKINLNNILSASNNTKGRLGDLFAGYMWRKMIIDHHVLRLSSFFRLRK